MPYIKKDDRIRFEEGIKSIVAALKENGDVKPGDINYVFSTILWELFKEKPSYTLANSMVGAMECVKLEFYRRQVAPYEDAKIKEHGDI